jgi:hypothetical protein
MRTNVAVMFLTACSVFSIGGVLLAEPAPLPGKCCGSLTSDDCCGCFATNFNSYFQAGSTNTYVICEEAPAPEFKCETITGVCFSQQKAFEYSQRNGSGCTSTCQTVIAVTNYEKSVTGCTTYYGGCD